MKLAAKITRRAILLAGQDIVSDQWEFDCNLEDLSEEAGNQLADRLHMDYYICEGMVNADGGGVEPRVEQGQPILLRVNGTRHRDLIEAVRRDQAAIEEYCRSGIGGTVASFPPSGSSVNIVNKSATGETLIRVVARFSKRAVLRFGCNENQEAQIVIAPSMLSEDVRKQIAMRLYRDRYVCNSVGVNLDGSVEVAGDVIKVEGSSVGDLIDAVRVDHAICQRELGLA